MPLRGVNPRCRVIERIRQEPEADAEAQRSVPTSRVENMSRNHGWDCMLLC